MKVQNVGMTNYQKQPNFTSVRLIGTKVAEVSEAGVKGLLENMNQDLDAQKILKALQNLVKVDEACSPNDTFKMAINGSGRYFKIFANPVKIAQPCSVCEVDVLPLDTLEKKLTDVYHLMKVDYIDTGRGSGISKWDNFV